MAKHVCGTAGCCNTMLHVSCKRCSGQGNTRFEFQTVVNKSNVVFGAILCNLLKIETVPPKRQQIYTRLHDVTSQKILVFIKERVYYLYVA